jgi:hypothetical protein
VERSVTLDNGEKNIKALKEAGRFYRSLRGLYYYLNKKPRVAFAWSLRPLRSFHPGPGTDAALAAKSPLISKPLIKT